MSKYSTIKQYEPLRMPSGWGAQEKKFIYQLENILDDVYKRFGRLTFDDFGKSFQRRIEGTEGTVTTYTQYTDQLILTVQDKYDRISGITIESEGVSISGSQYVKIAAGGDQYWMYNKEGLTLYDPDSYDWFTGDRFLYFGPYRQVTSDKAKGGFFYDTDGFTHVKVGIAYNYVKDNYGYTTECGIGHYENSSGIFDYWYCHWLGCPGRTVSGAWITDVHYTDLIQISSREAKHNIRNLEDVGEKIDALTPVRYVYNDDDTERDRLGLIYEDTIDILPEICTYSNGGKGINYVELVPALLKEVQSLRARVSALERGVA